MRILLSSLITLLLCSPATAVELFGVELNGANKGSLGIAARAAGASLLDSERPEVYEVFDSSEVLSESQRLYLGFDAQDTRFAFAEYHIKPVAHRRMLAKLKRKYGEPQERKGKFISDQLYSWQQNGISITYKRQFGCRCSRLRYELPAKVQIIRQQHAQVQKQRLEEEQAKQQNAY